MVVVAIGFGVVMVLFAVIIFLMIVRGSQAIQHIHVQIGVYEAPLSWQVVPSTIRVCAACGEPLEDGVPVTLYPLSYGDPLPGAYCYKGKLYVACMGIHCASHYLTRQGFFKNGQFLPSPMQSRIPDNVLKRREVACHI